MTTNIQDTYRNAKNERQKHVDAVLASQAKKKIVVAGPGTGKTHLFTKVLEDKDKNRTLTLTFINALVEDLSLELCGLSDVKTLHGFARTALAATGKNVKVFPKLSAIIKEDAQIILKSDINFDRLFHTRDDDNAHILFYKKRKDYYGHYGYADIVFAIVKLFEIKREKIPTYEQVVVDEFQDFNKLEVSLIELLAEKSPVLLAGDDDQALYDFKDASPEYIRQKHGDPNSGYAHFELPFCSRCARVIVEAANDVILNATANGCLKGRINKRYQYFENEEKDKDSTRNPRLIHTHSFEKQIPWFIKQQLGKIAEQERRKFTVLIISPTKLKSRDIVEKLKEKGLERVEFVERRDGNEPSLLDGLKLLLEDKHSNLGWRIAAKFFVTEEQFDSIIKASNADGAKAMCELINADAKGGIGEAVRTLKAVRDSKTIDDAALDKMFGMIGYAPREIAKDILRSEIRLSAQRIGDASLRKLPITATTIQSSKGLAADYVFITHLDDRYFIKNKDKTIVSDQDICNFLVALTRAKRKVFLISSDARNRPTFLKWIAKDRIDEIEFKPKDSE